jgi:hypothetical protein
MYERHYEQLESIVMARLTGSEAERRMVAGIAIAAVDGIGLYATVQPDAWPPARQRETLRALLSPHVPTRAELASP